MRTFGRHPFAAVAAGYLLMAALILTSTAIRAIGTAMLLQFTVNHWLIFAGRHATFPFWPGLLLGALPRVGNYAAIVCFGAAIVSFIAMFFL